MIVLRQMGRIAKPHGLAGDIKVAPDTDDPYRFTELRTVHVGKSADSVLLFDIVSARIQPSKFGSTVLLKLDGVDSRDQAEKLYGQLVFANQDDLPPLEDDEFYYSDVIGHAVVSDDGKHLGQVADIVEAPGQDKLVVQRPDGSRFMIPMVPEFLSDVTDDTVIIHMLDGLV